MTNDEQFIIKLNIADYQAMLKLDIDDEQRSTLPRLLAEAEERYWRRILKNSSPEHWAESGVAGAVNFGSKISVSGVLR